MEIVAVVSRRMFPARDEKRLYALEFARQMKLVKMVAVPAGKKISRSNIGEDERKKKKKKRNKRENNRKETKRNKGRRKVGTERPLRGCMHLW